MNPPNTALRGRALAAVYLATYGLGLIYGFQPPLVALILDRLGASAATIGALSATGTLMVLLSAPLYPRIIDRIGPRRAMIAGIAVALLAILAMPMFDRLADWYGLRVVTGGAMGLGWVASEIWLNFLATDRTRGTVMATYAVVFAGGLATAPLLLQWTGTAGVRPFLTAAALLALTTAPLALVADPAAGAAPTERVTAASSLALLRRAPIVFLAAFVAGIVESTLVTMLPVYGRVRGFSADSALSMMSVFLAGNVVLQLPIGWLADRWGRRRMLMGCAIAGVVGPLLLRLESTASASLWPLLLIWGGTLYGFYTLAIAVLGETIAADGLAFANTVFVMLYCMGSALGPTAGGLALDLGGAEGFTALLVLAAASFLIGILALRHIETRR